MVVCSYTTPYCCLLTRQIPGGFGHALQATITFLMAQSIVYYLEVVEIQKQD